MADDFNGQHQRDQPPDRSQELLEVLDAVSHDADDVRHEEDDQRHGRVRVDVGRRRLESGNDADQVGGQNKKPQRGDQGEELFAVFSHGVHQKTVKAVDDDFHHILQPARINLEVARGHKGKDGQKCDNK